jgi:formamidopyrimidine-DNA glycosylase
MPELPDIALYVERAQERLHGQVLRRLRVLSPFVLRTALPPIAAIDGLRVAAVQRLGKRVVLRFEGGEATAAGPPLFLVIHLMIAGRLRWEPPGTKSPGRITLAVFEFDAGQLILTEAGTQRRASIHLVAGDEGLAALDPGGADVAELDAAAFGERLQRENHTVKRTLTDPRLFSGIATAIPTRSCTAPAWRQPR